jgi:hypothetical protein
MNTKMMVAATALTVALHGQAEAAVWWQPTTKGCMNFPDSSPATFIESWEAMRPDLDLRNALHDMGDRVVVIAPPEIREMLLRKYSVSPAARQFTEVVVNTSFVFFRTKAACEAARTPAKQDRALDPYR